MRMPGKCSKISGATTNSTIPPFRSLYGDPLVELCALPSVTLGVPPWVKSCAGSEHRWSDTLTPRGADVVTSGEWPGQAVRCEPDCEARSPHGYTPSTAHGHGDFPGG